MKIAKQSISSDHDGHIKKITDTTTFISYAQFTPTSKTIAGTKGRVVLPNGIIHHANILLIPPRSRFNSIRRLLRNSINRRTKMRRR